MSSDTSAGAVAAAAPKSIFFDQLIYLLTGIATTLFGQQLSYYGAANKYSLLPVAAVYLGMASVWLLPNDPASAASPAPAAAAGKEMKPNKLSQLLSLLPPRVTIVVVAVGDIFANAICFVAMVMAGSGVFQVIYSSILIAVAFQSRLVLGKPISRGGWLWIGVVSFGLLLSGIAPNSGGSGSESTAPSPAALLMCIAGVLTYSVQYIVYECALSLPTLRVTGKQLCIQVGVVGSIITCAYIAFFTLPNYDALIRRPMAEAGPGNETAVLVLYALVLACHCAHNITYFNLVGSPAGAVGAGLLQALRAVGVFGLSSFFFCSVQRSQCFDMYKGVSTAVVVAGVLGYSKYK